MGDQDIELIVHAYTPTAPVPMPPGSNGLALALLDSIHSTGIRYSTVERLLDRYRAFRRTAGADPESDGVRELLDAIDDDPERFATDILRNRNLTASRNGVLKSIVVLRAAEYVRLLDSAGDLLDEAPEKMSALRGLAPRIRDSNGCIIFTQTIALAQSAARALRDEGVTLSVLTAEQSHEERSATLSRFSAGTVDAIVAPRLLDEGIDVPDADLGIVVSASRSRRQMVQRMGRVIRTKEHGGRATFVVMYGRETREDPANGAHAAFLDEVLPLAQDVQTAET